MNRILYSFTTVFISFKCLKAGNGLGMKIVGGRTIPGTKTVGAYVAAIYQGGVAEQLLGELQEGEHTYNTLNLKFHSFHAWIQIIIFFSEETNFQKRKIYSKMISLYDR